MTAGYILCVLKSHSKKGGEKITESNNMHQHMPVKQSYVNNISVANLTRKSYTKQHIIIICNKS